MFKPEEFNGTHDRQENSTHVVSMAYVPDGEYDRTSYVKFFFSSKEDADAFAKPHMYPPECPIILTIEEHDKIEKIMEKHRKRERQDYGDVDPYDRYFNDDYQV